MSKPGPKPMVKEPYHPVQDVTEMQRKFCDYLAYNQGRVDRTEAALKAGFAPKHAKQEAYRLWQKSNVQRYYRWKVNDVNKSLAITRSNYLQRLIKLSNKAEFGDLKENCAPLEALIGKAAGLLTTVIHNVSDADLRELREEETRLKKINEEGLETQKLINSTE
jgi:hypothetical protein